jgi:hypothetical protein
VLRADHLATFVLSKIIGELKASLGNYRDKFIVSYFWLFNNFTRTFRRKIREALLKIMPGSLHFCPFKCIIHIFHSLS